MPNRLALAFVLITVVLIACQGPTKRYYNEFYDALTSTENGELETAVRHYNRFIARDTSESEAYYNLADLFRKLGRFDEADRMLRRSLEVEQYGSIMRAQRLFNAEEYEAALEEYRRRSRWDSLNISMLQNYATTLNKCGFHQEADSLFRRLAADWSLSKYGYNAWGSVQIRLGNYRDAISKFRKVLKMDPGFHHAHYNWAYTLVKMNEHEKAVARYRKALEIEPSFLDAYINLGDALRQLGRYDHALETLRRGYALDSADAALVCTWGEVLHDMGEFDNAIAKFERAAVLDPGRAHTYQQWAESLLAKGDKAAAIRMYSKALELDPDELGPVLRQQLKALKQVERNSQ